ncbi:MAG: NosD domain-containing protein [Candidatus Bathyarchaeia archaeon]|jgi:parallel beta-helix repeat protein
MKKTISTAIAIFALLCPLLIGIQTVEAEAQPSEGVCINPDGSVTGTDSIQRNGDVYTLTGNISGGIQVQKSYIVIDGAGYTVRGTGAEYSSGISLRGRSNVTASNFRVESFYYGVIIVPNYASLGVPADEPSNNCVTENMITNCTAGIVICESSNNTVTGNILKGNVNGIQIVESSHNNLDFGYNSVSENIIEDNVNGIWIERSSNNTIAENTIKNNNSGINGEDLDTAEPNVVHHNAFVNNTENLGNLILRIVWDESSEGNYWSDYTGLDENGDGIGDTPYTINDNNRDNYPLMEPNMIPEFQLGSAFAVLIMAAVSLLILMKKKKQ